jgi:hypothetical protein
MTAFLQELKFLLQDFQQVATVGTHAAPVCFV